MNTANAANERTTKTLSLVQIAVGTALMAVCSSISVPTVIPFTLQTFAVFLVLLTLGGKRGTLSVIVYILTGAAGLPVFSGFTGGIGVLFGKTGGYIIGFVITGLIYSLFTKLLGNRDTVRITALLAGLFSCYAFGTAWFMFIYMQGGNEAGLVTVLGWCVFPFIIPDLIKLSLAFLISKRVAPAIR